MNKELLDDKLNKLRSKYEEFDGGHNVTHFDNVMQNAIDICEKIGYKNIELIQLCVAYHDIGLTYSRKNHEMISGLMISDDDELKNICDKEEIKIIRTVVEEHRTGKQKTLIESKILADADKLDGLFGLYRMFERCINTNVSKYDKDSLYDVVVNHLRGKYGKGGTMKLELNIPDNNKGKKIIEKMLADDSICKQVYEDIMYLNTLYCE